MGFRFRKSFKIAPGVKVNLGKKSAGISFGGKHGRISYNTKSGTRVSSSIPGTGISYSSKLGGKRKKSGNSKRKPSTVKTSNNVVSMSKRITPKKPIPCRAWYIILAILFLVSGIFHLSKNIGTAILTILVGVIMLYFTFKTKSIPKIDDKGENQNENSSEGPGSSE